MNRVQRYSFLSVNTAVNFLMLCLEGRAREMLQSADAQLSYFISKKM